MSRRHLSTWATIIMVPAGPLGPRFFGYIIRYEGQDGRYTCEPASVEGRYVE